MKTVTEHIRTHLLKALGVEKPKLSPDLEVLKKSEWSEEFETLMRNRLLMGSFRYGRMGAKGKKQYDRLEDIIYRANLYKADGNVEWLVDIANQVMLEFVEGTHPKKHLNSQDDGTHHTKEKM